MDHAPRPSLVAPPAALPARTCRTVGCSDGPADELGFCCACRVDYERRRDRLRQRIALAIDVVRAANPTLFATLDAVRPEIGHRLALRLAQHAEDTPGAPTFSLHALDQFLVEVAHPEAAG